MYGHSESEGPNVLVGLPHRDLDVYGVLDACFRVVGYYGNGLPNGGRGFKAAVLEGSLLKKDRVSGIIQDLLKNSPGIQVLLRDGGNPANDPSIASTEDLKGIAEAYKHEGVRYAGEDTELLYKTIEQAVENTFS